MAACFPEQAQTNSFSISEFSTIHYRIYADELLSSSGLGAETGTTDRAALMHRRMKLRSRAHFVESVLRQSGCLISLHANGPTIWVFSGNGQFPSDQFLAPGTSEETGRELRVGEVKLFLRSATGTLTLRNLTERISAIRLVTDPQTRKALSVHLMFYEAFVSALTKSISTQLSLSGQFLPINGRTFVSQRCLEQDLSKGNDDDARKARILSSLAIEPRENDEILVTLNAFHQESIYPLSLKSHPPQTNIWLSPSGRVGRYKGPEGSSLKSLCVGKRSDPTQADQFTLWNAYATFWKEQVLQILNGYGVQFADERIEWAEVELILTHDGGIGDYLSHLQKVQRILWPAKLCFTKIDPTGPRATIDPDIFSEQHENPFEFAGEWLSKATERGTVLEKTCSMKEPPPPPPDPPLKTWDTSRLRKLEQIESLAPLPVHLDLQAASSIYPTPPDGLPPGTASVDGSQVAPIDSSDHAGVMQQDDRIDPAHSLPVPPGASIPKLGSDDETSRTDFAIGTGMYGARDEEDDLFGEMDVDSFEDDKGLTDADFSFFDQPDDIPLSVPADAMMDTGESPEFEGHMSGIGSITQDLAYSTAEEKIESPLSPDMDSKSKATQPTPDLLISEVEPEQDYGARLSTNQKLPFVEQKQALSLTQNSPHYDELQTPQAAVLTPSTPIFKEGSVYSGHYNPVSFKELLGLSDRKYSDEGRFFFAFDGRKPTSNAASPTAPKLPNLGLIGVGVTDSASDDDVSITSNDTTDDDNGKRRPAMSFNGKQRGEGSDAASTLASGSIHTPTEDIDQSSKDDLAFILADLNPDVADWSLIDYFVAGEDQQAAALPIKQHHRWPLSQTILDQITQTSLTHAALYSQRSALVAHASMSDKFKSAVGKMFHNLTRKKLPNLASSANINTTSVPLLEGSLEAVPLPFSHVRRNERVMELLPTAIPFWEAFNLEPLNGPKNVVAYCICPSTPNILEGARTFMDRLGQVYQKCNLGTHARGDCGETYADGLVPWKIDPFSYNTAFQNLQNICEAFGRALADTATSDGSAVVYIINPFTSSSAFRDICTAFLDLFDTYKNSVSMLRRSSRAIEIIPQILPIEVLGPSASFEHLRQAEYVSLAFEIYGRYPSQVSDDTMFPCGAVFNLADPLRATLTFKKTTDESSSVLKEGRCLHLALSQSLDDRWLCAAWSDNIGTLQMAIPYCLRAKGSTASRPYTEIRAHIWETTWEIIRKSRVKWRLFLAVDGAVDNEDVEAWTSFVTRANQAKSLQIELTIVVFDTRSCLSLSPPQPLGALKLSAAPYSTPVSTPNVYSPEQVGNISTPGAGGVNAPTPGESTTDATEDGYLNDMLDDTWVVILARPLNTSRSLLAYKPSLASGYLIRRQGILDCDGVTSLLVHLVHTQSERDGLLKDILRMYRGLATLARMKEIACAKDTTLPWHVATALCGQQVLSEIL